MTPRKNAKTSTPVQSIKHKDKRANIPTEELRDFVAEDEKAPKTLLYPRDPSLDPQLVWKEKVQGDSGAAKYNQVELKDGRRTAMADAVDDEGMLPDGVRLFRKDTLTSQRPPGSFPVSFKGKSKPMGVMKSRSRASIFTIRRPVKSATLPPTILPAGLSTQTTTGRVSSSVTPTSSAQTNPTRNSSARCARPPSGSDRGVREHER